MFVIKESLYAHPVLHYAIILFSDKIYDGYTNKEFNWNYKTF